MLHNMLFMLNLWNIKHCIKIH